MKEHVYTLTIQWTGNKGEGTLDYTSYERDHTISADGKQEIPASSDPACCSVQDRRELAPNGPAVSISKR